ncbi:hypothetical protein PILCRDRAFT_826328 [Piloderma croceum F 1598]|uniref:DUF6533 domain-containing protein n=1 Tax=Piloderma croceum (strain F 1598) TaxID=765440 RepID=A0A0C3EUY2_PILCF|nr:hypothetical protein PILCRDRAFT_826328 [Piloderma croceum F 1598]
MSDIGDSMPGIWLTRAVGFSGYTLLVWDFLLTFDDEVTYIWPRPWSIVQMIFLTNRYVNLVTLGIVNAQRAGLYRSTSPSFCFNFNLFSTVIMFSSFASIHVLVLLRAWALWEGRRKIAKALIALFVVYVATCVSLFTYGIVLGGYYAYVIPDIVGTCISIIPSWAWTIWLPSILLECISPLVRTLYRDGIAYFSASLFSGLCNIVTWVLYQEDPRNMLATMICLCLVNIAGQRLVLGLRIINATSEEFTTRRMDLMIDQQIAAFGSVSVSSQGMGGGTWEAVDIELKNVDVLSASKETVATAAKTAQGKN